MSTPKVLRRRPKKLNYFFPCPTDVLGPEMGFGEAALVDKESKEKKMLRNIKTLGLALVAVLAMSALTASAASAAAEFHSSAEETELVAGQVGVHEFVVNTGVVVCEEAHFTGVQEGESAETVTVHPEYSECEFEGLFGVTVNTEGCDYVFHASTSTDGTVDIVCTNYIQVGSLGTCRIRVTSQAVRNTITYEVVGFNVKTTAEVTGISYSESGLFCAGGAVNNGTYNGISVVEGNGGSAELSVS